MSDPASPPNESGQTIRVTDIALCQDAFLYSKRPLEYFGREASIFEALLFASMLARKFLFDQMVELEGHKRFEIEVSILEFCGHLQTRLVQRLGARLQEFASERATLPSGSPDAHHARSISQLAALVLIFLDNHCTSYLAHLPQPPKLYPPIVQWQSIVAHTRRWLADFVQDSDVTLEEVESWYDDQFAWDFQKGCLIIEEGSFNPLFRDDEHSYRVLYRPEKQLAPCPVHSLKTADGQSIWRLASLPETLLFLYMIATNTFINEKDGSTNLAAQGLHDLLARVESALTEQAITQLNDPLYDGDDRALTSKQRKLFTMVANTFEPGTAACSPDELYQPYNDWLRSIPTGATDRTITVDSIHSYYFGGGFQFNTELKSVFTCVVPYVSYFALSDHPREHAVAATTATIGGSRL